VGVVAAYNVALSGDPMTLPWFLQGEPEQYGFGRVWSNVNFVHTPLGALQNLLVVAVRMNAWWLGWPLSLAVLFRRGALRRVQADAPIFVAVSLAIIIFEFGYYSTGISDVGPIYHFELLLGLCVVGAHCVLDLLRTRPQLAMAGLVVHVLLGTGSFLHEQSERLGRLADAIHREAEQVMAQLPARSLLLYDPDCSQGTRVGWMHRPFAGVTHDPRAPVVTYGRPLPEALEDFLAQFPDRACFYVHRPAQQKVKVLECEAARALLLHPLVKNRTCPYVRSTAERLGWFDPTRIHRQLE
jgi:hypothetical protein